MNDNTILIQRIKVEPNDNLSENDFEIKTREPLDECSEQILYSSTVVKEEYSNVEIKIKLEPDCEIDIKDVISEAESSDRQQVIKSEEVDVLDTKQSLDQYKALFTPDMFLTSNHLRKRDQRIHVCNICDQKFNRLFLLDLHLKAHRRRTSYQCIYCDRDFLKPSCLTTHMKVHEDSRNYKCEICDYRFEKESTLKNHMRVHVKENTLKCDVCNKTFRSKSNLNRHKIFHVVKERKRLAALEARKNGQEVEKKFKCDKCDKRYRARRDLNNHQEKIHNGEQNTDK